MCVRLGVCAGLIVVVGTSFRARPLESQLVVRERGVEVSCFVVVDVRR